MVQPTQSLMSRIDVEAERMRGTAETHRVRATRKITTADRRSEEVGWRAFDWSQARGLRCRAARHCRLESERVGMRGAIEHIVHASFLDNLARIHDRHLV